MINITQEQIMQCWEKNADNTPLVSIRCITYNHEPYIGQALDGFLMQRTTFPFEIIVHDDASTDKTADIIRRYESKFPKIIKPIYETENQYSKHDGSMTRIVNAALRGKYVAFCEGDDYWIYESKLQEQIEFLEKNQEYGLCYTKSKVFNQKYNRFLSEMGKGNESFKEIFLNYDLPTATIMCRNDLYCEYMYFKEQNGKNWIVGDYPMSLWFSLNSKIKFIPKETSVYRVLEKSASHFEKFEMIEKFKISIYENIQLPFLKYYKKDYDEIKDQALNDINLYLCKKAVLFGLYSNAKQYSKKIKSVDLKSQIIKIICLNKIIFFIASKCFRKR